MRQTIIGFDSAWAGNAPGGICALTFADGKIAEFVEPTLARFDEAIAFIKRVKSFSDYALVALDQPTLVPNAHGIRPVERVAGSIVNGLGGGVQPANQSKSSMFGSRAPIWNFLDAIDARENPTVARTAANGLFLIEVFPALALPSLIPEIWQRRRAAKYNPASSKFSLSDWSLVTNGLIEIATTVTLGPVAEALARLNALQAPKKGDQDKLDAIISLIIGYLWRFGPSEGSMLIGDEFHGYMVTPVTPTVRTHLQASASKRDVPCDQAFLQDAQRTIPTPPVGLSAQIEAPISRTAPVTTSSDKRQCPECGHLFTGKGWGGIDAHWKSLHLDIMSYEAAWPIIRNGLQPSAQRIGMEESVAPPDAAEP